MLQYYVYICAVFTTCDLGNLRRGKEQSLPELKQYLWIYLEWLSRKTKLG